MKSLDDHTEEQINMKNKKERIQKMNDTDSEEHYFTVQKYFVITALLVLIIIITKKEINEH